jgi:hypothetical protein
MEKKIGHNGKIRKVLAKAAEPRKSASGAK